MREREREGRKRRKERARSNYRHLVENGILRMEDVEIGRQMNERTRRTNCLGLPDYVYTRLA